MALPQPESWWLLAVEGQESSPLASAPLAMLAFLAGWRSLLPTLRAVEPDLATLTVARAIDVESLEGDLDSEVVSSAFSALLEATAPLPVGGAGLALHPGTLTMVADRFTAQPHRTLVLFAIGASPSGPAVPGPG